ncbi:MAG TPA: hypothetical protein VJB66_04535 [Candidatus Nanoarchaeia archaeon]|nr:hypothetical protein [Candidatus Nanoarchaeia archaeon]
MKKTDVSRSLRIWFIIHFVVDYAAGIPLMIAPKFTLNLLGFGSADVLAARLVAAAFLSIGGVSLLVRNYSAETYRPLLLFKILWSLFAVLGVVLTIVQGAPMMALGVLLTYAVFSAVWLYYWTRMGCRA